MSSPRFLLFCFSEKLGKGKLFAVVAGKGSE